MESGERRTDEEMEGGGGGLRCAGGQCFPSDMGDGKREEAVYSSAQRSSPNSGPVVPQRAPSAPHTLNASAASGAPGSSFSSAASLSPGAPPIACDAPAGEEGLRPFPDLGWAVANLRAPPEAAAPVLEQPPPLGRSLQFLYQLPLERCEGGCYRLASSLLPGRPRSRASSGSPAFPGPPRIAFSPLTPREYVLAGSAGGECEDGRKALWLRGFGKGEASKGFPEAEAEGERYVLHWFEVRFLLLEAAWDVLLMPPPAEGEVQGAYGRRANSFPGPARSPAPAPPPGDAALQYAAYAHLRVQGLYPRCGLAFGADFAVYRTATPDASHSEYLCLCINAEAGSLADVVAHVRNANSYAKAALVCYFREGRLVCRVVSAPRELKAAKV